MLDSSHDIPGVIIFMTSAEMLSEERTNPWHLLGLAECQNGNHQEKAKHLSWDWFWKCGEKILIILNFLPLFKVETEA